jgi:glycosyltransferase involved in cell wall biosynthesis
MQVCLLTRYFDYKGTGVTRVATEVLKELESRGHTVHKISTKGTSLYSYFAYTALEIPLILPRRNIDVYHALATMESMWLPRSKSIATFLDLFTTTNPDRAGAGMGYEKWKLAIGRKYFEFGAEMATKCRFLVSISNKTKQDMIQYLGIKEDRIKVIRLGIQADLEPTYNKNKRLRIGTLGQFDKRKRIDLLIRQFKASKIDADLVIAGQGMDKPLLEKIANGDSRIRFLGLVPNDKLNEFYNSLDLFVFPSWIEGYGLPCVEAMACKKPVVVMQDTIMPDEIKKRCIHAENLTTMFDNYSQLEYVIKGLDIEGNCQFAKEHSWKSCVDEYFKMYEEIANG